MQIHLKRETKKTRVRYILTISGLTIITVWLTRADIYDISKFIHGGTDEIDINVFDLSIKEGKNG